MGVKLDKVKVKGFRSVATDDGLTLPLGSGMNAFVGPNNVGKSNVMRAIALAFGEDIDEGRKAKKMLVEDFRFQNRTEVDFKGRSRDSTSAERRGPRSIRAA